MRHRAGTYPCPYIIAFWAIGVGLVGLVGAVFQGQWAQTVGGVISVVLGLILLASPLRGALALVVVVGAFVIARGVLQLLQAVRALVSPAYP